MHTFQQLRSIVYLHAALFYSKLIYTRAVVFCIYTYFVYVVPPKIFYSDMSFEHEHQVAHIMYIVYD